MNLKKRELIITVIMMIIFLAIGINISVLAATTQDGSQNIIINFNQNLNQPDHNINIINTTPEPIPEPPVNNNIPVNNNTVENNNVSKNNIANTGLGDWGWLNGGITPWLIIGTFAVIATFAYGKIKEYNQF